MPNELRFASPIVPPAITRARIKEARRVDDTLKILELEIEFQTDGDAILDNTIVMTISDDGCTKVFLNEAPPSVATLFRIETVSIPFAFEQVMGAYFTAGGNTGALGKLQELGLLPSGSAT
jgi:hypothetical protein